MFEQHIVAANNVADRAKQFDFVEAIAVSGSVQNGLGTSESDVDTYIYIERDMTADDRDQLASIGTIEREVIDYWGPSDYFVDMTTGIEVDCMYFRTNFMRGQLERCITHHQAQIGYSTAFWHTIQQSLMIYDRNSWFAELQAFAHQPYPDELQRNIIGLNFPILRDIKTSYRSQIAKAVARDDFVSINHRIGALLASYFDIVFAVNKRLHPGEKRMMTFVEQCEKQPQDMQDTLNQLLSTTYHSHHQLTDYVDVLIDSLEQLLVVEGLI